MVCSWVSDYKLQCSCLLLEIQTHTFRPTIYTKPPPHTTYSDRKIKSGVKAIKSGDTDTEKAKEDSRGKEREALQLWGLTQGWIPGFVCVCVGGIHHVPLRLRLLPPTCSAAKHVIMFLSRASSSDIQCTQETRTYRRQDAYYVFICVTSTVSPFYVRIVWKMTLSQGKGGLLVRQMDKHLCFMIFFTSGTSLFLLMQFHFMLHYSRHDFIIS